MKRRTLFAALAAATCLTAPAFAQGADDCTMAQAISGMGPHAFDTTLATTDGVPDPLCTFFGSDDIFAAMVSMVVGWEPCWTWASTPSRGMSA